MLLKKFSDPPICSLLYIYLLILSMFLEINILEVMREMAGVSQLLRSCPFGLRI